MKPQPLETLHDIRSMMERSSRFISLSGLSGVAAGCCALIGAWFAYDVIYPDGRSLSSGHSRYKGDYSADLASGNGVSLSEFMGNRLFMIAVLTFLAALAAAFIFTWLRSRKTNIPIWGTTARRLIVNVSIPMIVGALFLWALVQQGVFGLIAPGCLIFYGLALVNASKYTLNEVRYLGYGQILLGLINLWYTGYGIYFWALGFGVLHIIYGIVMWLKYENVQERDA